VYWLVAAGVLAFPLFTTESIILLAVAGGLAAWRRRAAGRGGSA
jgi:hypothetical protein